MKNKHFAVIMLATIIWLRSVLSEPRNFHGKCAIRINEIYLGDVDKSYVELGKVCPAQNKFHDTKKLTGFAIIVVKAVNNTLSCKFAQKLNEASLDYPQTETDRGLAAAQQNLLERGLQSARDQARGYLPQTSDLPNSSNSTVHQQQIENYEVQTNARLFFAVDIKELSHLSSGMEAIILLHMDSEMMKHRLPCRKNQILETDDLEEIKDVTYDMVILYANEIDGTSELMKSLVPDDFSVGELMIYLLQPPLLDKGYSKCDLVVKNTIPSKFKRSPLTKQEPNKCPMTANFINRKVLKFPYQFKGVAFERSAKKLILNLVYSLEYYKDDKQFFQQPTKKLAAKLLNIADITITRFDRQKVDNTISKPNKKRQGYSKVMASMDDAKKELLYQTITDYYQKNKIATITQIHVEFVRRVKHQALEALEASGPETSRSNITEKELFDCSLSSFRKVLKAEGYTFGKIALRDSVIFEPKKILWRRKYLNRMRLNRETKQFNVIYLDETWVDPHSRVTKGIVKKRYRDFLDRRAFALSKHKPSRGGRIIVMAAGGRQGFVQKSNLVWMVSAKNSTEDYHANMNRDSFERWFVELMDNVEHEPKKYIFVIDNAPYHTGISAPLSNANKAEMISFLKQQNQNSGLEIPENLDKMLNVELKQIIKKLKETTPRYRIDDLARARGHEIARIPPYNCDLNPIEHVWNDIKYFVKRNNENQDIKTQVRLAKSALNTYSVELWNRHIDHIERLENEYYIGDQAFDDMLDVNKNLQEEVNELHHEASSHSLENETAEDDATEGAEEPLPENEKI